MPFVSVDYFAGIDDARRRQLQERMAAAVMESLGAPAPSVRVFTRAVDPKDVYTADGQTELGLPVVRVEFLAGRTAEKKYALIAALAHAASDVLEIPVSQVRTILFEKDGWNWGRGDQPVAQK